jgi:hypothetical protein
MYIHTYVYMHKYYIYKYKIFKNISYICNVQMSVIENLSHYMSIIKKEWPSFVSVTTLLRRLTLQGTHMSYAQLVV